MPSFKQMNYITVAGLVLVVGGLIGIALGAFLYFKANAGLNSLEAVYEAQDLHLTYNADGQFVDRGTVEGVYAILSLLENDWKYPLNHKNLDPNDTLINTPDEMMVQYATINYHTLHGTQTVVLDQDATFEGTFYPAGTPIQVAVDGRYFSQLDRTDPIEGAVREQAWSPLAFGLLGELGAGVASDYSAGLAHFMSWSIFVGLGFMFTVAGVFVTIGGWQLTKKAIAESEVRVRTRIGQAAVGMAD